MVKRADNTSLSYFRGVTKKIFLSSSFFLRYEENQFPPLGSFTEECFPFFDRRKCTCCGVTLGNHFNRRRSIGCILLLEKVRKTTWREDLLYLTNVKISISWNRKNGQDYFSKIHLDVGMILTYHEDKTLPFVLFLWCQPINLF